MQPPETLESIQGDEGIAKLKAEILQLESEIKGKEYIVPLSEESLSPIILSVNHR